MELTNFGSIMKFAIDSETVLKNFLEEAAVDTRFSSVSAKISTLKKLNNSNLKLLERTRREGICEMVLHPITDFHSESYEFEGCRISEMTQEQLISFVENAGTKLSKFYSDAALKLPADDAKRAFQKLAKKRYA